MSATSILAVLLTVAVVLLAVTLGRYLRQAGDLDRAHAELAAARAEIGRCRAQHLGDLDAVVRDTQPPGPPPMDAWVQPLGIHPINPPYRHRGSHQ